MSSSHKRELTITTTSKSGGATVTGDTITIPPDCADLVLAVTTDDSVSGAVNAILEVSVDGENWAEAKTRTGGSAGVPAQIAHGTVTMPALDAAAATQVCTITYAGGALGDNPTYTIEILTDTDNSPGDHTYYHLRNTTTGGSPAQSITGVTFGDAIVLQTYGSAFSFSEGYEHTKVTVKVTESTNGLTSEVQIGTAETGIFRRAAATMSAGSLTEPIAGNAATGTTVCTLTIGGGPVTGNTVTYDVVMEAHASSEADTDASHFRIKSVPTSGPTIYSTYDAGTKKHTITTAEGSTNTLETLGAYDASGGSGSDNYWFIAANGGAKEAYLTLTNTESIYDQTASVTISGITINEHSLYSNEKYYNAPYATDAYFQLGPISQYDYDIDGDNMGWWGGYGADGNIDTNSDLVPNTLEPWTISFWWKPSMNGNTNYGYWSPMLILNGSATKGLYFYQCLVYYLDANTIRMYWQLRQYIGGSHKTWTFKHATNTNGYVHIADDEWHHFVLIKNTTVAGEDFDAADHEWWVDGVQQVTQTVPTGTWTDEDNPIGTHAYSANGIAVTNSYPSGWSLRLDEWSHFNYAMTPTQVAELYNSGDGIDSTSLDDGASKCVAYWRMGDGSHSSFGADSLEGTGVAGSPAINDMSADGNALRLHYNSYSGTPDDDTDILDH